MFREKEQQRFCYQLGEQRNVSSTKLNGGKMLAQLLLQPCVINLRGHHLPIKIYSTQQQQQQLGALGLSICIFSSSRN